MHRSESDAAVVESFRLEELGQFAQALDGYAKVLRSTPHHAFAATRYCRLRRELRPDPPQGWKILWQIDLTKAWETEWVRYLLSACTNGEIVDGQHTLFEDGCIVVDGHIDPTRRAYYFELLQRGCRFGLFHLSDEHYSDDYTVYGFANVVLRNYWSRAHGNTKTVLAVPLGMMNGYRPDARKASSERRHIWSFAGNVDKASRAQMMAAMPPFAGGHLHATSAAQPEGPRPLDISAYAQLMSETIFALCPAGWENLDSFRVCEALEAGCIPIVERRPSFDYFRHLFGEHPMLTIDHWNEVPELISSLSRDSAVLESRRDACATWWQARKVLLVAHIRDRVLESVSPRIVSS